MKSQGKVSLLDVNLKKNKKWWQILLIALGIIFVIMMAAMFLTFLLSIGLQAFIFVFSRDPHYPESDKSYNVININGQSVLDNGSPYYFYASYRTIYRYSFEEDEAEVVLKEEQRIWNFDIYGDWIFYGLYNDGIVSAAQEVWEYNWVTGEKNLLLENAKCTYVAVYNDYLLYNNYGVYYIWEISEEMQNESMEMLELFREEDKSGNEQFMVFQGMTVGRYYNDEEGKYYLTCIMEEEDEKRILRDVRNRVLVDGHLFEIDRSEMEKKFYQLTGGYYSSDSFGNAHLTVENGKIIGLASAAYRHGDSQAEICFDFLFELEPKTGQMRILYRQEANMPRIIGYRDGTVYLMEDYKLYKEPIDGGERVELLDLPEEKKMYFYWYGDYLIVSDAGRMVIGTYLVE